jgi:hypothetical protein
MTQPPLRERLRERAQFVRELPLLPNGGDDCVLPGNSATLLVELLREAADALHEAGKCQVCADKGILPSEAIACALHSIYTIHELESEISVLRDHASASSRLHLALADLDGSVPSVDGLAELASVQEGRARLDRVRVLLEHALDVASYDDDSPLPAVGETRASEAEQIVREYRAMQRRSASGSEDWLRASIHAALRRARAEGPVPFENSPSRGAPYRTGPCG